MNTSEFPLAVICSLPALYESATAVALRLSIPVVTKNDAVSDSGFVLQLDEQGLALQQLGKKAPGPIRVDFEGGAVAHRRLFGGGAGQMIAKAVGVKASRPLQVFDATAGLGKDAFVLAGLGCSMTLCERNPVVAELLRDGLRRAAQTADEELRTIAQRMTLCAVDSLAVDNLAGLAAGGSVDIVYLDPMFPDRSKSAHVKKDMAAFHHLVGKDEDADGLLPLALAAARYRVVVKRPRKAPFLNGQTPTYQLSGKTSRYDIYVNRKLPD
jgi:16S rRNA (guanine1516-N2)-methyltransferase